MNLGSAVIEFMPTLPAQALRSLTQDAARAGTQAGTQAGQAMGQSMAQGVRRSASDVERATEQIGNDAGQAGGEATADSFASGLSANIGKITAIAGTIGVGFAGGMAAALDVSGANEKLRAQLNLNATESAKLGKVAGDLYASNYGASLSEVSGAIATVVQNIPSLRNASQPVLKDIAAGAMDVARVFEQDVAGTTRAVGQLMRTGLAPDAKSALDLITTGLQKVPNAGVDLLDTFNEYSTQFRKLGLEGPQALGLINQLMQGGARDTDVAADAMKEFSIRAVDGSETSAAGFKALGLNADKMTAAFAKGGPTAQKSFGLVIDKLNAMKDPVARNAAGVALFGTQWEDLGDAFRSADLDSAAASLGKVGGATKGIADKSATANIQGFIRVIQAGFVDIVGNKVIPNILKFGKHLSEHKTLYTTLAVVVGILGAAYAATSAVIAIQAAGGLAAYLKGIKVVQVSTKLWAGVQWLLNAALTANPIGLVIVGITALIAVIILAWRNSETFRKVVLAVWSAIKTAIKATVDWFTKTAWPAIKAAVKAIGDAFQWLWKHIISIWNAIKSTTVSWWNAIKATWNAVINFIKGAFASAWNWLSNFVSTIWKTIRNSISNVWANIRSILAGAINYVRGNFAEGWNWLRSKIAAIWNNIREHLTSGWNTIKSRVFNPVISFITQTIPNAFSRGVSAIRNAWNRVRDAAAKPVEFIVNTVLNNGIIKGFNWIAGKVGIDPIKPIQFNFASGGILPGYTPGRDVHRFVGPAGTLDLSGGEAIMRPEFTMAVGPSFVNAANKAARQGGIQGVQKLLGGMVARYQDGGIWGGIKSFGSNVVGGIKKAWDAVTNPADTFKKMVNGLLGSIPGGQWIKRVMSKTVGKMVDGVASWITKKFNGSVGSLGGDAAVSGGSAAMARIIHAFTSGMRVISGNRPGDWGYHGQNRAIDMAFADRSEFRGGGLAAKVFNFIASRYGKNTKELIWDFSPWGQSVGIWNGGKHTFYGATSGPGTHDDHMHWALKSGGIFKRMGLYDNGGWLGAGGIAVNMSRRPEAVLTPEESAGLKAMRTDKLVDLLEELIEAVKDVAPGVGSHIRGSGKRLITQARSV